MCRKSTALIVGILDYFEFTVVGPIIFEIVKITLIRYFWCLKN